MKSKKIAVIWYKKDLRCEDHFPLVQAMQSNLPTIAVYCFEPSVMKHPDRSGFHGQAIKQSLINLQESLEKYSIPLLIFQNECVPTFAKLHGIQNIHYIFAHEETGNMLTFTRDKEVKKRCNSQGIIVQETPNNGVIRKLTNRDNRMKHRKERMEQEIITPPTFNNPYLERETKNNLQNNCISLSNKKKFPHIQQAGEQYAHQRLQEFLYHDYSGYLYHIGRPLESTKSCSRLSIFLTYGNLSLRQVVQYTKNRRQELAHIRDNYKKGSHEYKKQSSLVKHIDGFTSRLHRHDHFIQKLESDTNYEFKNIHHYYDRIRTTPNQKLITAWETGQTGYPLIDAAMRCLQTTGRVNFRLRATLISFICNTCMQDRKYPAHVLAKVFTDYEPGIHYSQCQMQAGTVGINQHRIYNPTKQLLEKDPQGKFIDKWVPELRGVPMPLKAEPRNIDGGLFDSSYGVRMGIDYPFPIIPMERANTKARNILWGLKKEIGFSEIAQEIFFRHGSRKKSWKGKNTTTKK